MTAAIHGILPKGPNTLQVPLNYHSGRAALLYGHKTARTGPLLAKTAFLERTRVQSGPLKTITTQ